MSGEEQTVTDLAAEVDDLRERVEHLEALIEEDPESVGAAPDVSSFVADADPSSHPERALLLAYYLEQYEGQETFTTGDIEDGYSEARMQTPANLSDTLAGCRRKGWLLEAGEDEETQAKLRRLTRGGIEAAEEMIDEPR